MKTYGLIGYPLGHSFSKQYFTEKFERENILAEYLNFEIADITQLPQVLIEHPHLTGFNVTIPYKEQILPYLHEITPIAQTIGAVNVVKVCRQDGETRLIGYNSDIVGFRESLRPLLKTHHTQALVLGSGGASKAVCEALKELHIAYQIVSRQERENGLQYNDLSQELISRYPLIINTTPVGMFPHIEEAPLIPYEGISTAHILYDLVYNPSETQFIKIGKTRGCTVLNGTHMLHLQAEEAWRFWHSTNI